MEHALRREVGQKYGTCCAQEGLERTKKQQRKRRKRSLAQTLEEVVPVVEGLRDEREKSKESE